MTSGTRAEKAQEVINDYCHYLRSCRLPEPERQGYLKFLIARALAQAANSEDDLGWGYGKWETP